MNSITKMMLASIAVILISILIVKFGVNKEVSEKPEITGNVEKEEITIGTFSKSLGNVPYYVAKEKGWFEEVIGDDFILSYDEYGERSLIASALSSGDLEFAFSAEAPAILIEAQGEKIDFENLSGTLSQEVIVPSSSNMKSIVDLKGKRIAVLAGTSSHYALLKILADNNVDPSEVNIEFMPPAEAKVAFENGRIDAWAVWPPYVEQQQVTGFAKSLKGSNAVIQCVGYMPDKFIDKYPDLAKKLSDEIERAKVWMVENPEEAQKIAAKQVDLDIEVVNLAWSKFDWRATFNEEVLNDIKAKSKFLSEQKLTRNNIVVDVEKELFRDYTID